MSIKESIAKLKVGDPPIVVDERHCADYAKALGQKVGINLLRRKLLDGGWELVIGPPKRRCKAF